RINLREARGRARASRGVGPGAALPRRARGQSPLVLLAEPGLPDRVLELGELRPVVADEKAAAAERDDLEPEAVRILEERRVVVVGVLGIELRRRRRDAER